MQIPCPWDAFTPGTVRFCEERLCASIVEPANAWSNAGFLLVGLYLFQRSAARGRATSPLVLFGVTGVLVAVGSFLFHMTGTFWGEFLDLSAMFLISSLMLTLELGHMFELQTKASVSLYAGLALGSMLAVSIFRSIGIALFITHIVVWTLLVLGLARRASRYRTFELPALMTIFLAGYGVWNLDFHRVVCDPQNHVFNGHVVWHLTCAVSLLLYYLHQEKVHERPRTVTSASHAEAEIADAAAQ